MDDEFVERMAKIRARFATKLAHKLDEAEAELSILASGGNAAALAAAETYRRFHDVCGVGPTIGFNETGRIARKLVDQVLVGAFRENRGLNKDEIAELKEGFDAFRIAAWADMHSSRQ